MARALGEFRSGRQERWTESVRLREWSGSDVERPSRLDGRRSEETTKAGHAKCTPSKKGRPVPQRTESYVRRPSDAERYAPRHSELMGSRSTRGTRYSTEHSEHA